MDASGGLDTDLDAVDQLSTVVGLPAVEIAERVRNGTLRAVDVVRAHLAHIEGVDARIGAFRVVRAEAALTEAAAVDAAADRASLPLAGVPVAIKDNVDVEGEVCTDGSPACPERVATADHPVVARLRRAGAVVVGITRAPELCVYPMTDGPGTVTRNPWDTARSPAGSSGGSAAAVGSGSVPLAHGNDGMGSIRLPAAACGLVTLKPGRGVVPAGIGFDDWSGMAVNGVLATTVSDVAVAHAVLAGETPAEPPPPERPLRIAVSTRSPLPGAGADAETRATVDAVAALLVAAGHTVVRREPPISTGAAIGTVARYLVGPHDDAEHLGIDRSALQRRHRTHARIGRLVQGAGLVRPRTAERCRERMVAFFDDVDLLLGPVSTGPPLPARPWHERSFLSNMTASARWAPFTGIWNLAGLPAVVVPGGMRSEGLPVGVQFVGPPGAETRLLWIAGELERRQPWRRYAPVFDPAAAAAPA